MAPLLKGPTRKALKARKDRAEARVKKAVERGLCQCGCGGVPPIATMTNASRGDIKGHPVRFIFGHHARREGTPYRVTCRKGVKKKVHRERAERAIGRPLPPSVIVHHADGSRFDDAPLVICQDQAYHTFLHLRMRIRAAGGNPNTDAICGRCRKVKHRSEFTSNRRSPIGVSHKCRACYPQAQAEYRRERMTRCA